MTPERLASIRHWANTNHGTRLNLPRAVSNSIILDIKALCDEIERLKSITFEHPCVCDLYGDADANYISRITRLRETNRTLGETNERLRAVISERDAEVKRLEERERRTLYWLYVLEGMSLEGVDETVQEVITNALAGEEPSDER